MQVALIAPSGTPTAFVPVLFWSVVAVVVLACCWCSPLQLAPVLDLTLQLALVVFSFH